MANEKELGEALASVQKDLLDVVQFIDKKPDLSSRYKSEVDQFRSFGASMGTVQGQVNAKKDVSAQDAKQLLDSANTVILSQSAKMISTNSAVLGLSSMSMAKNISEASAKGLNTRLTSLEDELHKLIIALQTTVASDSETDVHKPQTPEVKIIGKPNVVTPPKMEDIKTSFEEFGKQIEALKHAQSSESSGQKKD